MPQDELRYALRLFQALLLVRETYIMVNPDKPHACPRAQAEESLYPCAVCLRCGCPVTVSADHMITAAVRTEMMLHCGIGMGPRIRSERRFGEFRGALQQQFQVHHIVDDHGELPVTVLFVRVPIIRVAPITGWKRVSSERRVPQRLAVKRIAGDADALPKLQLIMNPTS